MSAYWDGHSAGRASRDEEVRVFKRDLAGRDAAISRVLAELDRWQPLLNGTIPTGVVRAALAGVGQPEPCSHPVIQGGRCMRCDHWADCLRCGEARSAHYWPDTESAEQEGMRWPWEQPPTAKNLLCAGYVGVGQPEPRGEIEQIIDRMRDRDPDEGKPPEQQWREGRVR